MTSATRIGIAGDFDPGNPTHVATNEALDHAIAALGTRVEVSWVPTPSLGGPDTAEILFRFSGLWAAPGSPYRNMEGALAAIQFARERQWPFTGT